VCVCVFARVCACMHVWMLGLVAACESILSLVTGSKTHKALAT